jgi:hypothetical protein
MGKHGVTESLGMSTHHPSVSHAFGVVAGLAKGNAVNAAVLNEAKHTLLDSLASQPAADSAITKEGLVGLFTASPKETDKAELIGDLVGLGVKAAPVLDVIFGLKPPDWLMKEEINFIKDHLQMPPKEMLQAFTQWLTAAAQKAGDPRAPSSREGRSEDKSDFPLGNDDRKGVLSKEESDEEGEEGEQPDLALGPPDTEAEKQLNDASLRQDERLELALQLGEQAIRPLVGALTGNDPAQQRFAFLALNELGGHSQTARAVYEEMRHLESNPNSRNLAREILRNIQGQGTRAGSGARQRAHSAPVVDGWLRNAIDQCDAPNIMRAAIGHELFALPLVVRRLCELRVTPTP